MLATWSEGVAWDVCRRLWRWPSCQGEVGVARRKICWQAQDDATDMISAVQGSYHVQRMC